MGGQGHRATSGGAPLVEVDVATDTGPSVVRFVMGHGTVEVRHAGRCVAVLDRDHLRTWLARPSTWWAAGDVQWGVAADGRVVLVLVGVGAWTLTPYLLARLREQV